jgi:hypothetical protein
VTPTEPELRCAAQSIAERHARLRDVSAAEAELWRALKRLDAGDAMLFVQTYEQASGARLWR